MRKDVIGTFIVIAILIAIVCSIRLYNSYSSFEPVTTIKIQLPHEFRTSEAERLSVKAFELKESKNWDKAIQMYRQALKIEPDNPRLFFDLSNCYERSNRLEQAILALDSAILLDNSYAGFYNNRGLLKYKLRNDLEAIADFEKAIQLDTTFWVYYANVALAYYSENYLDHACDALKSAIRLGLDQESFDEDIEHLKTKCK